MTPALPITPARLAELMADLRPEASAQSRTPKRGCTEGAIGNAVTAASYRQESGDPDPLHVAAYLLRSLVQNHCYEDGNKRIAWMAALEVLWVNAFLTIDADEDEAAAIVLKVANHECSEDELIGWLAEHIVPVN